MDPASASPVGRTAPIAQVLRRAILGQIGLVLIVVVATTLGFAAYSALTAQERQTGEVLSGLESANAALLHAQTSHRGWTLVRRDDFFGDYEADTARVEVLLTDVRGQLRGEHRATVERIKATVIEWRDEFAEPIAQLLRDGRDAEADALLTSGQGQVRIDSAREMLGALARDMATDLLDQRSRTDTVVRGVVASLLVGAAALFGGAMIFSRGVRRRVTDPMLHLASVARDLGAGRLSARAERVGVEETIVVADAFNDMATRLEDTVSSLKELDEMKTQFVSSVSHELRTPLTSIRGYLEALIEHEAGELTEEQQEYAEIAYRNAGRLERLIEDLLTLSKLEGGRVRLNLGRVDVTALVGRLGEDFLPRAQATNIALAIEASDELTVEGDSDRILQVVANLVSNAIKFTPSGGDVRIEADRMGDEFVRIAIHDSGVGIPATELPQLFERFFRASTSGGIEGTGLGLAISRELVELHRGTLTARSQPGEGTTFTVTLPIDAKALDARVEPS